MRLDETSDLWRYLIGGLDHKKWYQKEVYALYKLLPEFQDLPIEKVFAVTSMTTSIEANVHLAIKALKQYKNDLPFSGFLPNQKLYLNLVREGYPIPGIKIRSFIEALEGDPNAVVVDVWMCRAFGVNNIRKLRNRTYVKAPSKTEYHTIANQCREYAAQLEIEPREFQSMVWAGIKREQSPLSTNVSWSTILREKKGMFAYA